MLPKLSEADKEAALERVARKRKRANQLFERMRQGKILPIEALNTPDIASELVRVFLEAVPGFGKVRVQEVLKELNIFPATQVRSLKENQRSMLAKVLQSGSIKSVREESKRSRTSEKVPVWFESCPSLRNATCRQREFYEYWVTELRKDNFVDVDGNLTYIFVYLYSVIEDFIKDKDIDCLAECFDKVRVRRGYSEHERVREHLDAWLSDAYFYVEEYDKAWELHRKAQIGLSVADFINFKSRCKDTSIDGQDLFLLLGSNNSLTKFGKDHEEEISKLATIFLDDFYKEHGKNLVEYFCEQFDFSNLTEDNFLKLKEFYPYEKKFFFWKDLYEREERGKFPCKYGHNLFGGAAINQPFLDWEAVPSIVSVAISNEGQRIFRECENTVREEKNLPKVGEGWISEAELYHAICEAFPEEKVVHHGRPVWLPRQHLDIYFPLRNVACEYQGAQHQEPIKLFGGEEGLRQIQKLDERKKQLCERHGCKLIYVYEGYDFTDIKRQIEKVLSDLNYGNWEK